MICLCDSSHKKFAASENNLIILHCKSMQNTTFVQKAERTRHVPWTKVVDNHQASQVCLLCSGQAPSQWVAAQHREAASMRVIVCIAVESSRNTLCLFCRSANGQADSKGMLDSTLNSNLKGHIFVTQQPYLIYSVHRMEIPSLHRKVQSCIAQDTSDVTLTDIFTWDQ